MINDLLLQVLLLKVYRILLITCVIAALGIAVIAIEITFLIIIVKAFKQKNE